MRMEHSDRVTHGRKMEGTCSKGWRPTIAPSKHPASSKFTLTVRTARLADTQANGESHNRYGRVWHGDSDQPAWRGSKPLWEPRCKTATIEVVASTSAPTLCH